MKPKLGAMECNAHSCVQHDNSIYRSCHVKLHSAKFYCSATSSCCRVPYLDGSDDEQVLQVVIVAEAAVLQHDLLQELNELALEASLHEGLHCH